jgi:hypothetical protein
MPIGSPRYSSIVFFDPVALIVFLVAMLLVVAGVIVSSFGVCRHLVTERRRLRDE